MAGKCSGKWLECFIKGNFVGHIVSDMVIGGLQRYCEENNTFHYARLLWRNSFDDSSGVEMRWLKFTTVVYLLWGRINYKLPVFNTEECVHVYTLRVAIPWYNG